MITGVGELGSGSLWATTKSGDTARRAAANQKNETGLLLYENIPDLPANCSNCLDREPMSCRSCGNLTAQNNVEHAYYNKIDNLGKPSGLILFSIRLTCSLRR